MMFQGPENVLHDVFMNPETKPVVEASGHVYDGTVITRGLFSAGSALIVSNYVHSGRHSCGGRVRGSGPRAPHT